MAMAMAFFRRLLIKTVANSNRICYCYLKKAPPATYAKSCASYSSQHSQLSQLSEDEEGKILEKLNQTSIEKLLEIEGISSSVVEDIAKHRNDIGPFKVLFDFVSLPSVDDVMYKLICEQFLKMRNTKSRKTSQKDSTLKCFSPNISSHVENVQSVTSLEVCVDCVCFASVNKDLEVTSWNHLPIMGPIYSKQTPSDIVEQALQIVDQLPKSSIYLAETRKVRRLTTQLLPMIIFLARLQSALHATLVCKEYEKTGKHVFFHVNDVFVPKVFGLMLGGERISGQQLLKKIKESEHSTDDLYVPHALWQKYHRLHSDIQKERYANSLLLPLAFFNHFNVKRVED